jgi:hypothetical protein
MDQTAADVIDDSCTSLRTANDAPNARRSVVRNADFETARGYRRHEEPNSSDRPQGGWFGKAGKFGIKAQSI